MKTEKLYCPNCGEELTNLGYNYDNGMVEYECKMCDSIYNDSEFEECSICGEKFHIDELNETDDFDYICKDCNKNKKETF